MKNEMDLVIGMKSSTVLEQNSKAQALDNHIVTLLQ